MGAHVYADRCAWREIRLCLIYLCLFAIFMCMGVLPECMYVLLHECLVLIKVGTGHHPIPWNWNHRCL